jgi:hypothetical protein
MTRRSIFERMKEVNTFTLAQDLQTIRGLYESKTVILDEGAVFTQYLTLEQFIDDKKLISTWKHYNRCIDCASFRKKNGIDNLNFSSPSPDEVLTYLEYIANMIQLVENYKNSKFPLIKKIMVPVITYKADWSILCKCIQSLAEDLKHEVRYFDTEKYVLIVEKSHVATMAAELVDDKISGKIFEYNHYLMKGNLDKKSEILFSIGKSIESEFPTLKKYDSTLESNIGFLINYLNIRHNNLEGMRTSNYLLNLSNEELEKWYDKTYDVLLYAILTLDYIKSNEEIKELRKTYKSLGTASIDGK